MGIHGLTKLLGDHAPSCSKEQKFDNYFGRKIAVDASMHIYQFMVVVGRVGDQLLQNEAGDVTSHIQGMFYRTARMLEAGIKPVYVFEGKPPQLKLDQLAQRTERRTGAEEALKQAHETGDAEAVEKYSKRTVKVTREHNEDCKRLLRLMGVPVLDAPSEAEAQCAELCKAGICYGIATEDMDALTFGSPRLIRHLMASTNAQAQGITEFDLEKVLEELKLTMQQFIDLCILCGCDYATNIKGIGPVRALQLIQKHGGLDAVIESLDKTKYPLPEPYPFKAAREFFLKPEVTPAAEIPAFKWSAPDEEGLVDFLVKEKNFNEDRVRKAVQRINANKGKASQGRLESFFGPALSKPKPAAPAGGGADNKRKQAAQAQGKNTGPAAKKGKMGVGKK